MAAKKRVVGWFGATVRPLPPEIRSALLGAHKAALASIRAAEHARRRLHAAAKVIVKGEHSGQ